LSEVREFTELSEESEEELGYILELFQWKGAVEEDAQVTEDTKPKLEKVILAKPGMLTLLKREPHLTHLKSILNL